MRRVYHRIVGFESVVSMFTTAAIELNLLAKPQRVSDVSDVSEALCYTPPQKGRGEHFQDFPGFGSPLIFFIIIVLREFWTALYSSLSRRQ